MSITRFLERVADQRAGHAVSAAAPLAQLEPLDGDDLYAGLACGPDRRCFQAASSPSASTGRMIMAQNACRSLL